MSSWKLTTALASGLVAIHSLVLVIYGTDNAGVAALLRSTARTSMLLFLAAWTASSLHTLLRSDATRWLMTNRRALGLGAAFSHTIHLGAIAWHATHADGFAADPVTLAVGGVAYLFFLLMAATSNDLAVKALGKNWQTLHRFGGLWIWFVFLATNATSLPAQPAYAVPVFILLLALGLRIIARLRRRQTAGAVAVLIAGGLFLGAAPGAPTVGLHGAQEPATIPFNWVNPGCGGEPFTKEILKFLAVDREPEFVAPESLHHRTFKSPSMNAPVGYCIYLPPGYDDPNNASVAYPVVYHLHGGRPGNESRSALLSAPIDAAIRRGFVAPAIYVFPNGGHVSHYDSKQHRSLGKSVFVRELLPHIESTYRTIPGRSGRGLQGFSQGGRGTVRIALRHPELFCSAAPGGAGYSTEKMISESGGVEDTPTARRNFGAPLEFEPGVNAWELARKAAAGDLERLPPFLLWVGTRGFNYSNNLEYMKFLEEINFPFERMVVPNAGHHPGVIYETHGVDLMTFHERACGWKPGTNRPELFAAGSTVERNLRQHRSLADLGEKIWWRATGTDMEWNNKNLHQVAPTANIARGGAVRELSRRPHPEIAAFSVSSGGQDLTFGKALESDRSATMGVVILHRGDIVFESYPGMQPHEKPIWWSVTKVLASTLIGMLEDRGLVNVQQPVETYVPELAGSDFEGVRVRDVLDMASGVDCPDDDYTDTTTCYMQFEASLGDAERNVNSADNPYDFLSSLEVGKWAPPGTGFNYSGANTFVLGWIVERIFGMPFQDVVSQELWTQMGAEHDASIYAGRNGIALTSGGLLATPRDVARFGLLFTPSAHKTAARPIISSTHVETLTDGGRPELLANARGGSGTLAPGVKHNVYQWDTVFTNNDLYKGGWAGQGLLVNPDRDLVAVWVGYSKDDGSELRMLPLIRQVLEGVFGE